MKIQQLKNRQYVITIPKQLALAKGFNKGDEATWELDKRGNLVLKKIETVKELHKEGVREFIEDAREKGHIEVEVYEELKKLSSV